MIDKPRATQVTAFFSLLLLYSIAFTNLPAAHANTKLPAINSSTSFQIPNTSEVVGFTRIKENWIIAGVDSADKSWVAQYTAKGEQLWRIFPIDENGGGDGFITAITVAGSEIVIAGISQNPLSVTATPEEVATPTPTPIGTGTPQPSPSQSAHKNIPLANPDNVTSAASAPLRGDIKNFFKVRIDVAGKILTIVNGKNSEGFIPTSIATSKDLYFIVGNEVSGENRSRGALKIIKADGSVGSFTYGSKQTTLTRVVVTSATSLTVVGSSADTLADRAVAGRVDGVVLTISQSTGALTKVLRSSGKGAIRSWDFASGNLLVSGTSRTGNVREGVVTSFTSKAAVVWTKRFSKSVQALATGSCIAVESSGTEVFLYRVDSKGKELQGARAPGQDLIALATTATKGCAILSAAANGEFRVSYL